MDDKTQRPKRRRISDVNEVYEIIDGSGDHLWWTTVATEILRIGLSPVAVWLYMQLDRLSYVHDADHTYQRDYTWDRINRLAKQCGVAADDVASAKDELLRTGLLEINNDGEYGLSTFPGGDK